MFWWVLCVFFVTHTISCCISMGHCYVMYHNTLHALVWVCPQIVQTCILIGVRKFFRGRQLDQVFDLKVTRLFSSWEVGSGDEGNVKATSNNIVPVSFQWLANSLQCTCNVITVYWRRVKIQCDLHTISQLRHTSKNSWRRPKTQRWMKWWDIASRHQVTDVREIDIIYTHFMESCYVRT